MVVTANNIRLPIKWIGDTMQSVINAEGRKKNLLFVSQLTAAGNLWSLAQMT